MRRLQLLAERVYFELDAGSASHHLVKFVQIRGFFRGFFRAFFGSRVLVGGCWPCGEFFAILGSRMLGLRFVDVGLVENFFCFAEACVLD